MRDWSPEQCRAIEHTVSSLLVSAAAGSGKTATLSERCAHLVCDKRFCEANQLLVVTFTEEAAAEMKSRVEQALRERLEKSPSAWVKRQLALLPGAQISTIHAFCARLLKQHFQAIQLDPAFGVLDEQEAALLQREVAGDLFEDAFAGGSATFTGLVDLYADGKDIRIEDQVIETHNVLCSLQHPDEWRHQAIERLREVERTQDFFATAMGREFVAMLRSRIERAIRHADAVLKAFDGNLAAAGCDVVVEGVKAGLQQLLELIPGQWEAARAFLSGDFIPGLKPAPKCEERDRAKGLMDTVRDPVKSGGDIHEMLSRDAKQLREEVIKTIAPAECFLDLVGEFSKRYEEAKQRENVVDFSDLEHLALKVLDDPAIAKQCQDRFASIMVDEFQDVNALQWELIRRVARCDGTGRPMNLFCVGDVKQSIYRFRLADPAIFMKREDEWRPLKQVVDMRHNFRSRRPLLESINYIFRDLMHKNPAEIDYDEKQELDGQRKFSDDGNAFPGSPIELHALVEDEAKEKDEAEPTAQENDAEDLTRVQKEALYTAALIERLVASGRKVTERDGTQRLLQHGDIAVLLRSAKFTIVEYSRAIAARGIPVFAESRTGFFQASEINEILSILRLLDNQQQDIPIAAILRGQILGVDSPENAMARLRLAYRDLPFHAAVVAYAREGHDELADRLKAILVTLERWRERSLLVSAADLLWEIFGDTGYVEFCRALQAGAQRVANLMYLHRCARKFSGFRQQGLFRFLKYIEQLEEKSDLGQPSPGEPGNAVRVMTVHGSKGLEFPVVILSGVGSKWNMSDGSGAILVNREQGLAVSVADAENDIRYPSVASWLAKERIRRASLAEELRVLYVAMTRAQEHLVLVGSCKAGQRDNWKALPSAGDDPQAFLGAGNMLQWLVPLVGKSSGQLAMPDVVPAQEPVETIDATASEPATADSSGIWTFSYPYVAMTQQRASNSVTGLSKGAELPQATPDATDDSADKASGDEARQRGIAVHLFMEHFDFAAGAPSPEQQLQSLISRGIMKPEQAAFIDTGEVSWLTRESGLAAMLAQSPQIVREIPMLDSVEVEAELPTAQDRVLLRGRIDAIVRSTEGLVVVDYKTDRKFPEPGSERELAYRKQMELYRGAIERSGFGRVAGVKLVFLHARRVLEL